MDAKSVGSFPFGGFDVAASVYGGDGSGGGVFYEEVRGARVDYQDCG